MSNKKDKIISKEKLTTKAEQKLIKQTLLTSNITTTNNSEGEIKEIKEAKEAKNINTNEEARLKLKNEKTPSNTLDNEGGNTNTNTNDNGNINTNNTNSIGKLNTKIPIFKCTSKKKLSKELDTKRNSRWNSWTRDEKVCFYEVIANASSGPLNLQKLFKIMNEVSISL